MKKVTVILAAIGVLTYGSSFAQCCNVVASNGTAVTSSEGTCVTLTYATSDCLTASVASGTAANADSDGDGVTDEADRCPSLAGIEANRGCPAVLVEVWTLYYLEMKDVRFENGSDELTPASFRKLDNVAGMLKKSPDLTIKVSGYADSVGTEQSNRELSAKRAVAVKKYLVSKGVPAEKVVPAAYGEKFPKAPNETQEGRAANRRVEFDLFY